MKPPSVKTLQKYGLSEKEWLAILARQGGVCAVCGLLPKRGIFRIDHAHVPKWKKLKPHVRKLHVRGLLCYQDNHQHLRRGMTQAKAESIAKYLIAHNERIIAGLVG